MELLLANVLAVIGSIVHILALSKPCDKSMKKLTSLSCLFMAGYFFLLGLPIAGICTIVTIARYYLSANKTGIIWLPFAFFYFLVAIVIPPENLIHVFPAIASIIGTYALFNMSGLSFRFLMLSMTTLWILYAIYSGAYIVAAKESILFVSSCFAIFQIYKNTKFEKAALQI